MLFNGTMCIGRLLGNTLGKHLSSKQVVVGGYLLGAVAMGGLIVALPGGHASMYTYLLLGISLAMIVPNLFSAMGGTECYSYDAGGGDIDYARLYGGY